MKGFITNIEEDSLKNENFRKVLYTTNNCQLVLMSIAPGDDIGAEVHTLDQFIRCEKGEAKVVLGDVEHAFTDGWVVVVPAGVRHNIINLSATNPLKLYTLYAPPNHKDGTVHKTKAEGEANEEHFDGVTSA